MAPAPALRYGRNARSRFVAELTEFLRFPSVSSDVKHRRDVRACASWLAQQLRSIGLQRVEVIRTSGNPLVYASWRANRRAPTLLIYGHYDVVPADPSGQWKTPPFSPTVKGEDIYARGACDDKGQLLCHVKALECFLRTRGALPLNVKCIFEGEEEIGSANMLRFVEQHKAALRADAAVISDTKMQGPDQPAISYAQRGGLRAELMVRGPKEELHSGSFGGAVLNPIQALCEVIAGLHDERGRVAIPGFYEGVRAWGDGEREYMARVGPTDEKMLRAAHVEQGWGEAGYTAYERTTIRPALTLNGISGGHAGEGSKGVIPEMATAKLSFRLVPDQDPRRIAALFREHVARLCPAGVRCSVQLEAPTAPVVVDRRHPAVRTAAAAYSKGFGRAPVFLRSGGSIPVASAFQELLGIPVVLMGFGLPDDRIHGPNEKFHLPNFYRGIESSIWYMSMAPRTLASPMAEAAAAEAAAAEATAAEAAVASEWAP
jgi:acetylornithine deacetylase/succinyl-diaminopimelate desuccinylase-like protein